MTEELMLNMLTADKALAISEEAAKKLEMVRVKEKSENEYQLSDKEKAYQFKQLIEGIKKKALAGKMEYSIRYNTVDKETGEPIFSQEFFIALCRAFKDEHPTFFVQKNIGPARRLTIKWSGKYEV